MAQRRLSYRLLGGFLIIWLVLFILWRLYQAPREAQARLAHMRHVLAVVTEYVRQHQGAWPRSWEEIENTRPPSDAPPRQGAWPDVRAHVKVDFAANPRKLLEAGPDQFQAVSPKGRCSGDYREDVQRLLEAIRQSLPPETGPEKAPASVGSTSPTQPAPEASSESAKRLPKESPKEQPSAPSPESKPSDAEKPSLPGKLPGLPEQPIEKLPELPEKPAGKLPAGKPSPPPAAEKEKPSPKETPEPPSKQPSRIILPGLD